METKQTSAMQPLFSVGQHPDPAMELAQKLWNVYGEWHLEKSDSAATLISAKHHIEQYGKSVQSELLEALAFYAEVDNYKKEIIRGFDGTGSIGTRHPIIEDNGHRARIAINNAICAIAKAKGGQS